MKKVDCLMSPEVIKLIEKLEETALFLRPLNYFWYKAVKAQLAEIQQPAEAKEIEAAWLEKTSLMLYGRNQLGDLFISPPKEREQFQILRKQLAEILEAVKKKEV